MPLSELVEELRKLAARADDHPMLELFNPASSRYYISKNWDIAPLDGVAAFGEAAFRELGWPLNTMWRDPRGSVTAFSPGGVANWLVAQTRSRPAEDVLEELRAFAAENKVNFLEIVPVWGIDPSEEIDRIDGDIRLVPAASLPPSDPKDAVTGVRSVGIPEIAKILVVAISAPVVAFGSWTQSEPGTPYIHAGSGGFNAHYGFLGRPPQPHVVDAEKIRSVVRQYFALSEANRRQLHVALTRLNSALIDLVNDPVQSIIDLGIAMESFLCTDDEKGEVIYRFALRGSRYAAEDPPARKAARKLLKDLYGERSVVAHGRQPKDIGRVRQLVVEARDLFVRMLSRSLEAGSLPKWTDVELE